MIRGGRSFCYSVGDQVAHAAAADTLRYHLLAATPCARITACVAPAGFGIPERDQQE